MASQKRICQDEDMVDRENDDEVIKAAEVMTYMGVEGFVSSVPEEGIGSRIKENEGPKHDLEINLKTIVYNYALIRRKADDAPNVPKIWTEAVMFKLKRVGITTVVCLVIHAPRLNSLLESHGYKTLHHETLEKMLVLCCTAIHHYEIEDM